MPRFAVNYTFHARSTHIIEAGSLEDAQAKIEAEVDSDDFHIDADDIDDVDFSIREMHPVTRGGKEMWTTYVLDTDKRGHASALASAPLFSGVPA